MRLGVAAALSDFWLYPSSHHEADKLWGQPTERGAVPEEEKGDSSKTLACKKKKVVGKKQTNLCDLGQPALSL